jgi:membrane-associated phospholipid phosphatase
MPRRASLALLGAVGCVGLLVVAWYAALHVGFLARADHSILSGFADLRGPRTQSLANFIAHLCDPNRYVYLAAAPVLVALGRRRPRVAVAIVAILFGANVTTQILKPLLAVQRPSFVIGGPLSPIGAASWPSGHATAAMSLALCSVLAAPMRWRPLVAAVGAAFAVAVSYSFLALGWHFPSDVFGGFLVAATWALLGVAAIFAADARWPRRAPGELPPRLSVREALAAPAAAVAGGLALAGLVLITRPHQMVAYASAHKAFVVGAGAIGVLGMALATGVMLVLRTGGRAANETSPAPTAAPRRRSRPG